ncbi:polyribonucleotide nucleotidyltransferase [Patescibacteria group bacterium]|nr:MAG: polyribonucleotide nucleotidyltransferase [Patescibacteria group bacterium]
MQKKEFSTEIGGKTLTATFTDLAEQAHGSVLVRYGNTIVMATAVMGKKERTDIDYFPLTVEYEEKFYASGQILGSRFMRREGRPSEEAVLSGRVIDRTIRPLFDHNLRQDVQVVTSVLSIDEDDPDVVAVNAASIATAVSSIPWGGPVSAVRIGMKRGSDELEVNPTYASRDSENTILDVLVCGKDGVITMIEVGAKEVSEDVLIQAFEKGVAEIEKIQEFQKKIIAEIGKIKKEVPERVTNPEIVKLFDELGNAFSEGVFSNTPGKEEMGRVKDAFIKRVAELFPTETKAADVYFDAQVEKLMRERAIEKGERVDGRKMDELRPLYAEAGGFSPILHGSGVFYRGGTHVFSALTLGGPDDSLIVDSIEGREQKKRFMHHYNFPPFSVGETGRFGGMNRRMIGHGALAEKALSAVIPPKETFPYTIRLVSEAFSSNGSTSMGSVCASVLALMDGGVPIKAPVAGIAMGIFYDSPSRYAVMTDIQGPEDHHGDMDFKVAGTAEGVTAIQLDVKVEGVPVAVLTEGLASAKRARLQILARMNEAISAPRPDISPRAPKIVSLTVPVDMIGMVIGPQGKNIRKIEEETGVTSVTIEDDGTVFVTGKGDAPEKAANIIKDMTRVFHSGDVIEGEVTRLMNFGAFVRIGGKAEGLVHISEIAPFKIATVEEALAVGEKVKVVVKEIDDQGRVNLSIKMIDPEFAVRKNLKPAENDSSGGERRGYNDRQNGGGNRNGGGHRW